MVIQAFVKARPYLYHLTDRANLVHIAGAGSLRCAGDWMEQAGRADLLQTRRQNHERLTVPGRTIVIRDQAPLHRGNLLLPRGFTFEEFIESLNRRIFFWPGSAEKPISYGVRHFERYREEKPAILRIHFQALIDVNPTAQARFCPYNSGSPRCSYGQKSPRGPATFQLAKDFDRKPSQVVEVTFDQPLALPAQTSIGSLPTGPWQPFF